MILSFTTAIFNNIIRVSFVLIFFFFSATASTVWLNNSYKYDKHFGERSNDDDLRNYNSTYR